MNRAERRRQDRAEQKELDHNREVSLRRMESVFRQGGMSAVYDFWLKLYEEAYTDGMTKGREEAEQFTIKLIYADAALAYKENAPNVKKATIERFLRRLDDHVCQSVSSTEEIDKVFEDIGIEMTFDNLDGRHF